MSWSLSFSTGEELVSLLVYGCQTTMSDLGDERNTVYLKAGRMSIQGTLCPFSMPESPTEILATMPAAYAVFYLPFRGPSRALFEVLYRKALGFSTPISGMGQKVLAKMGGSPK